MKGPLIITNTFGDHAGFALQTLEALRTNAEARLRRYGLTAIKVNLADHRKNFFALEGGTDDQRRAASRLLAD